MVSLPPPPQAKWQFFIDRGGTFTDIIAKRPDGKIIVKKFLSDNPAQYRDAAIFGIRDMLGLPADKKIPSTMVAAIKMGTTVATNALLERKGQATALVTTTGFTDILRIAGQQRPDIFALEIIKPEQLYSMTAPITERIDVAGNIITPLDKNDARQQLQKIYDAGIRGIAVVFMHAVINPTHEQQLADIARDIGFTQIALSHIVSPLIKIAPRGDTTVISAYLSPILHRYMARVTAELEPGIELLFMQSGGGLTTPEFFHGENSLLSGPAGGVIAAVKMAAAAGFKKMLSFDMGGTSTDTAHFAGTGDDGDDYEKTFDTVIAGVRVRVPMLKVETLAAGGGSICKFDGTVMTVGPESAGSNPGPACYGRGGPLTITDCHVMLGRLRPESFPSIFGHDHRQPLDTAVVAQQFSTLATQMKKPPEDIAAGFLHIADQKMAAGIKKISIAMGHDIKDHLLIGFGGNGGQHVCAIAEQLGLRNILLHPLAGVLSALGIGMAGVMAAREQTLGVALRAENLPSLLTATNKLLAEATAELAAQHITPREHHYHLHCRYHGSDVALPLAFTPNMLSNDTAVQKIFAQFQNLHQQKFGFTQDVTAEKLMVDIVTVTLRGHNPALGLDVDDNHIDDEAKHDDAPQKNARVFVAGKWQDIPIIARHAIMAGKKIIGPAIITESISTNFIAEGWAVTLLKNHSLLLTQETADKKTNHVARDNGGEKNLKTPDPILLEVFNNRFMAMAEQMGETLRNTAFSVNIKERLDFSCAIFDASGDLIANAPHIPVHLGSMADSVRHLIHHTQEKNIIFNKDDSFLTNSPYHGGTHLPDLTVISPVFVDGALTFFVASRGHHTDIGGISPGSMSAHSKHISEEGILIDYFHLVKNGTLQGEALTALLTNHPYPVRNLGQNFSDIHAQLAANNTGIAELIKTCAEHGRATTVAYMNFMKSQAEAEVKKAIGQLRDGHFSYRMDNGAVISLSLTIDHTKQIATVDFTGTSPPQENNFNAPFAIVKSVLLYVFRTLVDKNIPMNEGCLAPIRIILPDNCMLRPQYPSAVVAGNVETSQVIADCLYGAMGVMAACQGTMNNLTFGNDQYQYYETIAGGTGAGQKLNGKKFHGADAVHSHMTNSRMTDPEIMEARFPIRILEYAIRRGSGGGRKVAGDDSRGEEHPRDIHTGGNGFTKRLLFLESMTLNILANHRVVPPFGLGGGPDGRVGENHVTRADGTIDKMTATDTRILQAGDIFTIHTPGGGGMGNDKA
ncbi:MAG: hydantoinase B/oxoprolinase family protein [Hydrotalea sp.]|nr:hydantoinase B/oxoprolinase family protein [Hydrotalea sp.]